MFLAGSILLVYQMIRRQPMQLDGRQIGAIFVVSWFFFLGANFLLNCGQKQIDSGVSAILVATTPLWIGLFGMFWPHGERLTTRGWLGVVIGFVGIVLTKLNAGVDHFADPYAAFILGSAASWALGSLISRQLALPIPHLTSAGYQMFFGGGSQVLLGTALGEWRQIPELNARIICCFIYLLIFGSLLGFVAFNWLLGHIPTAKVGTYAYVNPVIAVFLGLCVGEKMDGWIFAGIAVILLGVYLVRRDHAPSEEIEVEPD